MEDGVERFSNLKNFYEKQNKKLLVIPFALLLISLILIFMKFAATGDILNRDVSLKGGITVTIPIDTGIDTEKLRNDLSGIFSENDIDVKSISQFGNQVGIIIEADITQEEANAFIDEVGKVLGVDMNEVDSSVEVVGSSLGTAFFKQLSTALMIAFGFMALIVFLYFRTLVPSAAVILAAFSDIIITLAIVNLTGMKLSAAGIAAFLMLIGYSVDTNILLSMRVLKRREGTEMDRVYGAMKTGFTMTSTTLVALFAALLVSQSEVIRQIMIILLIGLLVDMINTWIQNVAILRMYLEKKNRKLQNV